MEANRSTLDTVVREYVPEMTVKWRLKREKSDTENWGSSVPSRRESKLKAGASLFYFQ